MTQDQTIKFCYSVSRTYLEQKIGGMSDSDRLENLAIDITASLFQSNGKKSFISQMEKGLDKSEEEFLLFSEIKNRIEEIMVKAEYK